MHRTSGDSVIIDCSQVPRGGPMPACPWARSWIPPVAPMRSARPSRLRRCFRLMWVLALASAAWFYLGSWNYVLSATHELQRESDGVDIDSNVQGLQGGRGGAFEGVRVVMAETLIGEGQSAGSRQGNDGKGLDKISATQQRFKELDARGGRSQGEMEVKEEGEEVLEVGDGVDVKRRVEDRHGRQGSGKSTGMGGEEGSLLGMAMEEAEGMKLRVPFPVQPQKAAVPGPRAKEQAENGTLAAGAKGGGEAAEDEAIRCRMSRICDGGEMCRSGADAADDLGCISAAGERQQHIREAILWSWKGYKRGAWGQDELLPLSSSSHQWFGLGLTLVDSLDTLLLAGLDQEYREARDWVLQHLNLQQGRVNLFEVTIRVLAGLLSAAHLAGGDLQLAALALQLGLRLLPAFDTGTGIPLSDAHLTELKGYNPEWTQASSLSEVTTLSLEYSTLAQLAQREDLRAPAMRVWSVMNRMDGRVGGLAPIFVDPWSARFTTSVISLGARGDSYYEYMLKQWILSGKKDKLLLKMYKECMGTLRRELLQKTRPGRDGLLYVAEMHNREMVNKFDHLVCFLPGLLALGHFHGVSTLPSKAGDESDGESFRYLDDLTLAQELMHTCYQLYRRTPAGLAPEIAFFSGVDDSYPKQHLLDVGGGDFTVKPRDSHNLLRPETVESLFVLFRVTRQQRYRDWGWNIFRAFQKHCRVDQGGYANLDSVLNLPAVKRDKMESFWLGETLKYLWLLFSDDASLLPLEDYVFNTEAHPLPVRGRAADNFTSATLGRALAQLPRAAGKLDRDSLQQQIDAVARAAAAARPS